MISFTLDTNCVIAVDEGRPEAGAILQLAGAHSSGAADVVVVAMMASEKQKPGDTVRTFDQFEERLQRLGLGHLGLCFPLGYWGVTFWGKSLWAGPQQLRVAQQIHEVLFQNIEFDFQQFCSARKISDDGSSDWKKAHDRWRNATCDVQALWSHTNTKRNVFVTGDNNFLKVTKKHELLALGAGRIERPWDAAALL